MAPHYEVNYDLVFTMQSHRIVIKIELQGKEYVSMWVQVNAD